MLCENLCEKISSNWHKSKTPNYQLYLAINETRSQQTTGISERFHSATLQEFYQVTFRKWIYRDIETLQADLDEWMEYFSNEHTPPPKR